MTAPLLGSGETLAIVGGGQAAAWSARSARDAGFTGRLVMLCGEDHLPYERPPLSKDVLASGVAAEPSLVFPPATYDELAVELRRGVSAQWLDPAKRTVGTSDGDPVSYSRLLLCTGGSARPLRIEGADRPGVHTLRTIDDARRLGAALRAARRVAVIGGGWIGLEVASAARRLGLEVVVYEAQAGLCARVLPPALGEALALRHVAAGVELRLSSAPRAIREGAGGRLVVESDDGSPDSFDLLVAGVGLTPNDELARDAGLDVDGGVIVDANCRTSDPYIYAAGDVTLTAVRAAGARVRIESWQNAQDQAICAARNAVGVPAHYDPLPWFWSDQHGFTLQILGFPAVAERFVLRGDLAGSYCAFFISGARVVAAVACDAPRELRAARRLIERGVAVRDADLRDAGLTAAQLAALT